MNHDSLDCSALSAELRALRAEVERIEKRPWDVLLEILNKVYPADIFPTTHMIDEPDRDPGPRIVALIRWVDELRAENERLRDASTRVDEEGAIPTIVELTTENERLRAVRDATAAFVRGVNEHDVMDVRSLEDVLDAAAGGA